MMSHTRLAHTQIRTSPRLAHSRTLLAACGLAMGLLAPSAHAQVTWRATEEAPRAGAAFTGHVESSGTASSGEGNLEMFVFAGDTHNITAKGTTSDGRTYEIQVKNKEARAMLDGKTVPSDRVVLSADAVELLDEDGSVIVTISTRAPTPPVRTLGLSRGGTISITPKIDMGSNTIRMTTSAQGGSPFGTQDQNPPKVMVGITMSGVDETLRAHFGLPEGAGIVVDDVFEGLPAARAGVQARDIIVSIDGKEVSNMALRGSLEGKEPGQRVKVRVIRKGESKDLDMLLDAYDPAKLGNQTGGSRGTGFFGEAPDGELHGFTFEIDSDTSRAMREAQRALEEAMATMNAQGMENQAEALNAAREQMRKAISEMQMHRYTLPNGEREIIMVPTAPAAPAFPGAPARPSTPRASGEGEDRARQAAREFQVMRGPRSTSPASASNTDQLTTLERRLDSLDQRFNRLDERIGKLLDRLERDE